MKSITLNLVKLNGSWFVDAPCQHLEDLRIIKETSAFIDKYAKKERAIKIQLKDGDATNANLVFSKGTEEAEGCIYNLAKNEIWLSETIKYIFGEYPDIISVIW